MADQTLGMILMGGVGQRLFPLTSVRAKPGVPFAKYRIGDFVLSNFVNSGIRNLYLLTQYKSNSLHKHVENGWSRQMGRGEFIRCIPPQQNIPGEDWYQGTANAVKQNLNLIESEEWANEVAVFSGDHIYKMNIQKMVDFHRAHKADVTIAALEVPRADARRFGVMSIDDRFRIQSFVEKPQDPPTIPGKPDTALASMGNYIFGRNVILSSLEGRDDFGKDVLPALLAEGKKIMAYPFGRQEDACSPSMKPEELVYWQDVGTLDSYFDAVQSLRATVPVMDLYCRTWPIITREFSNPPVKFVHKNGRKGEAITSLVSDGCIISGGLVEDSVLSALVRTHSYSRVFNSVLFEEVDVGKQAIVENTIADKLAQIPEGAVVTPAMVMTTEGKSLRPATTDRGEVVKGLQVTPSGIYITEPDANNRQLVVLQKGFGHPKYPHLPFPPQYQVR